MTHKYDLDNICEIHMPIAAPLMPKFDINMYDNTQLEINVTNSAFELEKVFSVIMVPILMILELALIIPAPINQGTTTCPE